MSESPERFGEIELAVAPFDAGSIAVALGDLRMARADLLATPAAERRGALVRAASRFLAGSDPLRKDALRLLPGVTGFSGPMIHEALDRIFGEIHDEALARAVTESESYPLVAIVSAGNVPGVAVPKMALALASGSACWVKPSAGEPLVATLFAEALAAESPPLGLSVGVGWWRGGASSADAALARGADSLIAYGSEAALAALHGLGPAAFTGYGHRVSAGFVRLERCADLQAAAREAAIDVAMYDQLGCLSPQCLFATGDRARRRAFADALAGELGRLATVLPRGRVPAGAVVAIRRWRDEAEWRGLAGEDVRGIFSPKGTEWSVVDESARGFRPGPLYRTAAIVPLESPGDLTPTLGEVRGLVECLGVLPFPDPEAAAAAERAGVATVAPLGKMQRPPLDRSAGGRSALAGIVPDR